MVRPTGTTTAGTGDPVTTVLIIDDHQMYADLLGAAIGSVPGWRCVGTAQNADEGIALAAQLKPAVAVVDIQMPGRDGVAATRQLRSVSPGTAVAIVSAHRGGEWLLRATSAGAAAFIGKDGSLDDMIESLRRITTERKGPILRPRDPSDAVVAIPDGNGQQLVLTGREREVLSCIGDGLQVKGMSRVLGISPHTCRGYIKTLYAKLGVGSRLEAISRARALGLLGDPSAV